jgi:23S rRNA (cytidine1920-2'-O)/16S rRNA (cytidine1409-2'-O)-methyltransferase
MKSFHRRTSRPATQPPHVVQTVVVAHPGSLRADQLLVARGLAPSRTVAQRLIESGRVIGPEGPVTKPSTLFAATDGLALMPDDDDRFVSRGGLKLAGALAHTGLDANGVRGRICLDVGQSTGGFTDCLLQAGARQIVGVDVGHGQLHPKLATDTRVEAHEGVNARELQKSALATYLFDLIVADVSFISLTLILPRLPSLLAEGGDMLLLVKPQFEVGPQNVGRGGIVRDPVLYGEVEAKLRHCCAENHLRVLDWFSSPITGTDGNHEFFLHLRHE